jgi:hypothetical protein
MKYKKTSLVSGLPHTTFSANAQATDLKHLIKNSTMSIIIKFRCLQVAKARFFTMLFYAVARCFLVTT